MNRNDLLKDSLLPIFCIQGHRQENLRQVQLEVQCEYGGIQTENVVHFIIEPQYSEVNSKALRTPLPWQPPSSLSINHEMVGDNGWSFRPWTSISALRTLQLCQKTRPDFLGRPPFAQVCGNHRRYLHVRPVLDSSLGVLVLVPVLLHGRQEILPDPDAR